MARTSLIDEKTALVAETSSSVKKTVVDRLPASCVPYAELMRLDRLAGFYAFYFPYLIGLSFAATLSDKIVTWQAFSVKVVLCFVWCLLLRGAVCTWNDNVDQNYDREVERCCKRPIARGAVTTWQAHVFTVAQALLCALILLGFPQRCYLEAAVMSILFLIYPFAKRVTHYPQLLLGFPFAAAIPVAFHTLGMEPWSKTMWTATCCLCLSVIMWTMIYDTIYAHQDLKDDLKAGVKSMAVRFRHCTKELCSALAVVQVASMAAAGYSLSLEPAFYVFSCGGVAIALGSMIVLVDLASPQSCAWWFRANFFFVGGAMFAERLGVFVIACI